MGFEERTLGRYRLVRRLGGGRMTEVFEARAVGAAGVSKTLCVKIVSPALARDRNFVQVFARQARLAMALQHGNIAQTLDLAREDGEIILAVELIDGRSVFRLHRRLMEQGMRLPVPLAVHVVKEVCRGLEYAQACADERGRVLGVVHGDLTPKSVMISFDGQVKVVDFGMGMALRAAQAGDERGSHRHMPAEEPPESIASSSVDVLGAGALLYELISGKQPVPVASDAREGKLTTPLLEDEAPGAHPDLCAIVDRALSRGPEDRYASPQALEEALSEYLFDHGEMVGEGTLGLLVKRAFSEELAAEGRCFSDPSDVGEQLESFESRASGARKQRSWLLAIAGGLAALALAAGMMVAKGPLSDSRSVREVEIRSRPPGARVFVDGIESGLATNGVLSGLKPEIEYEISVTLPGYEKQSRRLGPNDDELFFPLRRGIPRHIEPEMVESRSTAPTLPSFRSRDPVKVTIVDGEREVVIDGPSSRVPLQNLRGRWLELDPRFTHRLEVTEGINVAMIRPAGRLAWFAFNAEEKLLDHGSVHPSRPVGVSSGATRLLVLRLQGVGCERNVGEAVAVVRARGRVVGRAVIDGQLHCNSLEQGARTVIHGLTGEGGHRLSYEGPVDGPRLFVSSASRNPLALSRSADEGTDSILPGEKMTIYFVDRIFLGTFDEAWEKEFRLRLEPVEPPGLPVGAPNLEDGR